MVFNCVMNSDDGKETWNGIVKSITKYKSHCEIRIESRLSIIVIFGKTSFGNFACMPDFNCGCHLVNLKDKFWNTEMLVRVLGAADGITVASALFAIADKIQFEN